MAGLWPEIRAAKNGVFWVPAGTLYSVNGTASPDPFLTHFPNFPGMLARALAEQADGLWEWQPIGYPASVSPMRPSINAGISRPDGGGLADQIKRRPVGNKIVLTGYSQGAIIVDLVWRDHILDPAGDLHDRLDDVVCIVNWGDPMRCPGISRGNELAGVPVPGKLDGYTTGGIAGPDCLTPEQTPDFLFSRNNPGDLYGAAPVGDDPWHNETEVGHDERLIYEAVMDFTAQDFLNWVEEIAGLIFMPYVHFVPVALAIKNGLQFVTDTSPHGAYEIDWAVRHLIALGTRLSQGSTL